MIPFKSAERMELVHSDIRGPIFEEANRMAAEGIPVLKLNTGNPAAFGFELPDSVRNALIQNVDKAVAYCDVKGMPAARNSIYEYHRGKVCRALRPTASSSGMVSAKSPPWPQQPCWMKGMRF